MAKKVREDAGSPSIAQRRRSARQEANAKYEQRRLRLLEVAAQAFKDKGLGATSINDIAAQLGWDRASVYYYYGSKQEIYLDLIQRGVKEIVAIAESIAADPGPPAVRLRDFFESILEGFERHYPYLHIFIQEDVRRFSPEEGGANADLEEWARRFETAFSTIIKDGIARGEFRENLDSHVAILAMIGSINWSHRWFLPGQRLTGRQLGEEFAQIYLQGVRAPRKRTRTAT